MYQENWGVFLELECGLLFPIGIKIFTFFLIFFLFILFSFKKSGWNFVGNYVMT